MCRIDPHNNALAPLVGNFDVFAPAATCLGVLGLPEKVANLAVRRRVGLVAYIGRQISAE